MFGIDPFFKGFTGFGDLARHLSDGVRRPQGKKGSRHSSVGRPRKPVGIKRKVRQWAGACDPTGHFSPGESREGEELKQYE